MGNNLDKDPPTDDSKDQWLEDDARLFLLICNSIYGKVLTLINYCEYVINGLFGICVFWKEEYLSHI